MRWVDILNFSFYDLVYICTNIFGTYIIYRFMNIFFARDGVNKKIEILSYLGYYILISVIYVFVKIPIIMTISNISLFFILSFNYRANFKKRFLCVFLIYLILMCVEMIVVFFTGYFSFPIFERNEFDSIFAIIFIKILSYITVLVLSNFNNIKKGISVYGTYWICIALIPASTLYIMFILISSNVKPYDIIISMFIILFINFSVFYFYDKLSQLMVERNKRLILKKQNEYYDRQLKTMTASMLITKSIKHDIVNHLLMIQSLTDSGQYEDMKIHLSDILHACKNQKEYSNSGNIAIDSIINFKLQEAFQLKANILTDINIPENLNFPVYDVTVVLGNLFDNAVNALSKVEEERYISVNIKYSKGRLIIKIINSFNEILLKRNGKFYTTNSEKENHGFGIENVYNVAKKYDGEIDIKAKKNMFQVIVLLFID